MKPANEVAESLRRLEEEVEQQQSILRLINLPDKTSEKYYTDKVRLLNGLHALEQLESLESNMLDNFSIDRFGRIQVHTPGSVCKSFAKEFAHVRKAREARSILLSLVNELLDDIARNWHVEGPNYPENFPWNTLVENVQELARSEHPVPESVLDDTTTICDIFCNKIRGMKVLAQTTLVDMRLSDIGSERIRDVCHAFELCDDDWRTMEAHLARGDRFALERFVEARINLPWKLEKFLRSALCVRSALENSRVLHVYGFNPEQS